MPIKTLLFFPLLFFALVQPLCTAQLEVPDDTLRTDIAVLKTELKHVKETVNNGFATVQKNFDRKNNIIITSIGLPLVILAIGATLWSILLHRCITKNALPRR